MNKITFLEAEKEIYLTDIEGIVSGSASSASYVRKIVFATLFSTLISLPSLNYYWGIPLVSISLLLVILATYIRLNAFQKVINYPIYLYLIVQTGVIFFLTVFLYVRNDVYHMVPIIYILISYLMSLFIVHFKTTKLIRDKYGSDYGKSSKKSEWFATKTSMFLQGLVVLVGGGIILYRLNKGWLLNHQLSSDSPNMITYLLWGVGLMLLLIGLTLLPTLLIDPEKLIKYKLIETYAEPFRERYDYSKKEWYGDN